MSHRFCGSARSTFGAEQVMDTPMNDALPRNLLVNPMSISKLLFSAGLGMRRVCLHPRTAPLAEIGWFGKSTLSEGR